MVSYTSIQIIKLYPLFVPETAEFKIKLVSTNDTRTRHKNGLMPPLIPAIKHWPLRN